VTWGLSAAKLAAPHVTARIPIWIPAGVRDPIDGARHSLIGLHQHYAHNCTHDIHGAGGEAQLGACRIEYEIQPKKRDPEAALNYGTSPPFFEGHY
jgi:hypothetical protein